MSKIHLRSFSFACLRTLALVVLLSLACVPGVMAAVTATEEQRLAALNNEKPDFARLRIGLDGTTMAASAFAANSGMGTVAVYTRDGIGPWTRQATLIARTAAGVDESASFMSFGHGMVLDRDTIAVSSLGDLGVALPVWIYVRSGSTWAIQQRLLPPMGYTRTAVAALQNDTLVMTATPANDAGARDGLIYTRTGGVWSYAGAIPGTAGFEATVRLDGRTLVTSDHFKKEVYVHEQKADGTWAQVATLTPPETVPTGVYFPHDGAVSIDGDTIVVGASFANNFNPSIIGTYGKAFVYRRAPNAGWAYNATLVPIDTPDVNQKICFGSVTAIDGDLIAVGAPYYDIGGAVNVGTRDGATYLFQRSGGTWSQVQKIVRTNGGDILNGYCLALDGAWLAYGSRQGDHVIIDRINTGTAGSGSVLAASGVGLPITAGATTTSTANGTNFGSALINREARTRTFSLYAIGTSATAWSGDPRVRIVGANASDFRVLAQPSLAAVSSGEWATVTILFEPSAVGVRTARVEVYSDAAGSPLTFAISGTGIQLPFSTVAITGGATGNEPIAANDTDTNLPSFGGLEFGRVIPGVTVDHTFFLRNTGTIDLTLTGTGVITVARQAGPNWNPANLFSIVTQPGSGTVIPPGGSVPFTIRFAPTGATSTGAVHFAKVSIPYEDSDSSTPAPFPFIISGTVEDNPEPSIQLQGNSTVIASGDITPSVVDHTDFGNILVASGSVTRTFTIKNVGTANLTLTGSPRVQIEGSSAFTVGQPATGTVAAGGMTTFTVTCDPATSGMHEATITIPSNNFYGSNPYTFVIAAVGTVSNTPKPTVTVSGLGQVIADGDTTPGSADGTAFGSVISGGSLNRDFVVTNTGDALLTISGVTLGGADAAQFNVLVNPATAIDPGTGTTTLKLQYHPSAVGTHTATVTIASDDPTTPYTWTISGVATATDPTNGPGDLNGDKVVNVSDLTLVTSNFGKTSSSPGFDARADSNGDGVVNVSDLTAVTSNFGKTYL